MNIVSAYWVTFTYGYLVIFLMLSCILNGGNGSYSVCIVVYFKEK